MADNPTNLLLDTPDKNRKEESYIKETAKPVIETPFYCDALTEDNINEIIKVHKPELIVLLGLNDYGKSTFVGSLYHILRTKGKIGNYLFVDSDTYSGFERRVFLRKCNKDGTSAVKRTIRGQSYFLSLYLINKNTNVKRSIILSDKSGETYRDYISKDEAIHKDKSLILADRILFFINCEEIVSNDYGDTKDTIISLLSRIVKNDIMPKAATKYIVFNKFDKIQKKEQKTIFEKRKNSIVSIFNEFCKDEYEIKCFYVNSKGINYDEIDKGLKDLMIEVINPLNVSNENLESLDWVEECIKNS